MQYGYPLIGLPKGNRDEAYTVVDGVNQLDTRFATLKYKKQQARTDKEKAAQLARQREEEPFNQERYEPDERAQRFTRLKNGAAVQETNRSRQRSPKSGAGSGASNSPDEG